MEIDWKDGGGDTYITIHLRGDTKDMRALIAGAAATARQMLMENTPGPLEEQFCEGTIWVTIYREPPAEIPKA